ncbi:MAG TPA: serine protease [Sumerlaeia bacterium]|nr:serine protease [Sumerlaeia bacterium]
MTAKHHTLRVALCAVLLGWLTSGVFADEDEGKMTEGIEQQWLKTIVSVEQIPEKGDPIAIGTAFLVGTKNQHVLLVTAKHVIANETGQLRPNLGYRFNLKSDKAALFPESDMLKHAPANWFLSATHDVACRFIAFPLDSDILTIPTEMFLPTTRTQPGAPALVPGFPLGLRSPEHANPIVRRGIVARVDSSNFILDAFVYPGNSGSPILYVPTIQVSGGLKSPFINRVRLIGLVSNTISYIDVAVSQHTQRPRVTFEENSGLCNIVPADAILDLINRKEVRDIDALPDLKPKESK